MADRERVTRDNVSVLTSLVFEIPEQDIRGLNVGFIDGYVNFGNRGFRERSVPMDLLKQSVLRNPLPTTSMPNDFDFKTAYEELLKTSSSVVAIHQSSRLTGTVATAKRVAETGRLPAAVFDSKFIGMAGGYIAVEAAKIAKLGAGTDEVLDSAKKTQDRVGLAVLAFPQEPMIESQRYPGWEYRAAGKTVLMSMNNGEMSVNDYFDNPNIAYKALFTWFKAQTRSSRSKIAISHDWRVEGNILRGLERLSRTTKLAEEFKVGPESPHFTVHLGKALRFSYLISEK